MNCPSRNDDDERHPEWNQSPNALAADLTTRQDLNGIANLRLQTDHLPSEDASVNALTRLDEDEASDKTQDLPCRKKVDIGVSDGGLDTGRKAVSPAPSDGSLESQHGSPKNALSQGLRTFTGATTKFAKFLGPGFMIAVAYIDPGNYSTDIAAGAALRFKLLFVILMSNIFAVILQSLALRLGTVTGRNLAEHCREHLPKWFNWTLYLFAESAVVATDIAEVIGSGIAINLLIPAIPLDAACALTLADVLLILLFYKPEGDMRRLRPFEWFVVGLVSAVVICFCIELSMIKNTSVGEVFLGYVPSAAVVNGQGIYLSCGILGATVMPHSLYLGSGIVQPRLKEYDRKVQKTAEPQASQQDLAEATEYRPSLGAIKACLNYSTLELALSLCVFAFFVNSSILIVAGSALSGVENAENADLFGIFDLLSSTLGRGAGIIFAIALLFSGTSAGVVCTIAGQMISEGQIRWHLKPWLRRLVTRCISIIPSIIIAGAVGREGLSMALNASQVVLSVLLPIVSAPLLWFTSFNKYMTVRSAVGEVEGSRAEIQVEAVGMRNHVALSILAGLIWLVITIMDIALLVFLALGKD